jgi:malate dehydrogenase (oxaloacetate-decarboxylating)
MKKSTKKASGPGAKRVASSYSDERPGARNSLILRLKLSREAGTLSKVMALIGRAGTVGPMYLHGFADGCIIRDITAYFESPEASEKLLKQLERLKGVELVNVSNRTFLMHLKGKLEIKARRPIDNAEDLSMAYTPGVADVCMAIHEDPDKAYTLTSKGNTVAVVTDGSRILALGDIGPKAGLPVMEGKAVLFKRFADVDAWPICLDTQDTEEIIRTIKNISPGFGGINLEDIASPRCYEIEDRLRRELDVPVFHDDQHATAVVVTAGTINAVRVVGKKIEDMKVVAVGVGAAGMACCKMLLALGVKDLIGFNKDGAVHKGRTDLTPQEQWLAEHSNKKGFAGTIQEALKGADMFLGLSVANIIKASDLKVMARDPIVFALANPNPEVDPRKASKIARVMATGRSDYPNAINNVLVFPGIFRGALDCRVREITEEMKVEAARALAAVVTDDELCAEHIIPSVFDERVVPAIAKAVVQVAAKRGLARRSTKMPDSLTSE